MVYAPLASCNSATCFRTLRSLASACRRSLLPRYNKLPPCCCDIEKVDLFALTLPPPCVGTQWIKKAQPPLVILENVCSAPWEKVKERFRQAGYQAQFMRLDTKFYYIPHTRTRVYLMATLQTAGAGGEVPELWRQQVQALQRPSSSTLEAFLLPSDDPRVHRAREDLGASLRENRKATDWARCESRHQVRVRMLPYMCVCVCVQRANNRDCIRRSGGKHL